MEVPLISLEKIKFRRIVNNTKLKSKIDCVLIN